jgi:hypothetical protein
VSVPKRLLLSVVAALLLITPVLRGGERPIEPAFPDWGEAADFEVAVAQPISTSGGKSLTVTAARWQAPLAPKGNQRWRNAWLVSAGVLAAANAADVASSRDLAEQNPLLRNSQGGFDARKGALIKAGATGGLLLVQAILRRRAGDGSLDKAFTIVNGAAAGAVGATAVRNYGLR